MINHQKQFVEMMDSAKRLKNLQTTVRTEPGRQISDMALPISDEKAAVKMSSFLTKSLKNLSEVKKRLQVAHHRHNVLDTPLHNAAQAVIRRKVNYRKACETVDDWQHLVHSNRLAEKLRFPLSKCNFRLPSVEEEAKNFKPRTELELQSAEILKSIGADLNNETEITEDEKQKLEQLRLEDAKQAMDKLKRFRALVSYQERKYRRLKRIKSKAFHRLRKKAEKRRLIDELEQLIHADPAAAAEKFQQLERDRIIERATLRHRGTGTWSKRMKGLSKNDPEMRQRLQEQIRKAKELVVKLGYAHELAKSEDEEDNLYGDAMDVEEVSPNQSSKTPSKVMLDLTPKVAPEILEDRIDLGEQEALISEAFMEDDVVAEFDAEDSSDDESNAANLSSMPGWNSWTGPGIVEKKSKSLNAGVEDEKQKQPTKEKQLVYICKEADKQLRSKQIKKVPFPFSKAAAFEETLKQPIGKEWNPETAHKLIVEPVVSTKMGVPIYPIDRTFLERQLDDDFRDSSNVEQNKRNKKKKMMKQKVHAKDVKKKKLKPKMSKMMKRSKESGG
ncbi:U3 small nucleolar RNA-associated protein 14 -like protein A [Trichinella papuae]|uniref:U3 small nucleolar RNA-associated protein 14-like protein A n=1 Tax=Trichinella papuae TaxID=268474 RepID=A0A0V1N6B1_9BILA|nr:U3 small nucleolar RNA-associated protein 14 -like protein A [Trichinella papuae]